MFQEEIEEQFQLLRKEVEALRTEIDEIKRKESDSNSLIPEAEYSLSPVNAEVRGKPIRLRFDRSASESNSLGFTETEWQTFSSLDN